MKNQKSNIVAIDINAVKSRILNIRGQQVLIDRDVAMFYGVKTKEINQAVRNNPEKFPEGFVFQLDDREFADWKSKILTSNLSESKVAAVKMGVRRAPFALTERGLYMLATILKGQVATRATLTIVNTYAEVRAMKRELVALHTEPDVRKRGSLMRHFGETLTDLVMPDLTTAETESSLEINFFVGKLKHTVRRVKKADSEGKES